jgi:hypothetical protein
MPIASTDIDYLLSGGAANSDPALSLGGAKSSVNVVTDTLFDDVTSAEASAGDTEYRCIYVQNSHGSLTLLTARVFIQANTTGSRIDIALGGEGVNGTAETVANENTAPVGETFSQPVDYAGGLALGDLAPSDFFPVWVRRTIPAAAGSATDTYTLRVQGETNP